LDGVDLVKDPTDSGSLTRSTTLKASWYKARVMDLLAFKNFAPWREIRDRDFHAKTQRRKEEKFRHAPRPTRLPRAFEVDHILALFVAQGLWDL
jgi:hypothetical protein